MVLVLSDIHANLPALEAVMDDAPVTDAALFCGDLIGYNPWPNEVVNIAKDNAFRGVRGNHDEAIIQETTFGFSGAAGKALRWTQEQLGADEQEYLEVLPYTWRNAVKGQDVYIVHGSPSSPVEEYVYPEQVEERFLRQHDVRPDVLLMGHTHVPFAKQVDDTLVVNPGSVGQPRDGNPKASYAVLDPAEKTAEICRVDYDIDRVVRAVEQAELPKMIGERLRRGQ